MRNLSQDLKETITLLQHILCELKEMNQKVDRLSEEVYFVKMYEHTRKRKK
jgi:FtsZ-binding cell division protein ZapB